MEHIQLSCKADLSDGFELAIKQLGYQITDSTWDDENNEMHYTATKKSSLQTSNIMI